jgi:hypothetical protein
MVKQIIGYLLTPSPVPGNKLADKPAWVLISTRTVSTAKQFAFDLKVLKRATLVGEPTRGRAEAAVSDGDGISVEPDVRANESIALETAMKLAENRPPAR